MVTDTVRAHREKVHTHTHMHKLYMKIEKQGRRINRPVGKNKIFSTYFSFIGGTIGHSSPLFPH